MFVITIIISIFAVCSPLRGQSKDNIGLFSLRPIFFCSFLNFFLKIFGGSRETCYICSILQNIVTMTMILLKRHFLHAMVWKAETPQCLTIWHRTPKACLFSNPKKYSYDCKNQFGR